LSIDVSDKALDNLSMTIRTGSIQGRVSVTGTADPSRLDLADLRVSLIPRDGIPVQLLDAVPEPQAPDRNGNFAFSNVSRFKYGFQVNGLLLGWFVSDIRTGGVSIINSNSVGVDGGDPLQVEILLSPSGGRIEGTVAGVAGNPQLVLNSHVVLVPEDARRENFLGYRTASVGPDGGFTIVPSVAPGNYKIFAVTRLPGGKPELNAEFLSKYEDAAVPVTVEANETVRRDLQLIPAR
jgi:hypothetical protein